MPTDTRLDWLAAHSPAGDDKPSRWRACDYDDAMQSYLDAIEAYPLLSRIEQKELHARAHAGDKQARQQLISCSLRLVVSIARTYPTGKLSAFDLVQAGTEGLLYAIDKAWKPEKGTLSTCATDWINRAIGRTLHGSSIIHTPLYLHTVARKIERGEAVPVTQARSVGMMPAAPLSLDDPLPGDGTDADPITLADLVAAPDPSIEDQALKLERLQIVAERWQQLTAREQYALAAHFGFMTPDGSAVPVVQVARFFGVRRQRVDQITATALAKLKRAPKRAKKKAPRAPREEKPATLAGVA